ncbi:helix-turn-helix transcriptional regulator [Streptomyces sp. IBSBF 2435]|uniref:helix-turn-helix transcriptional regulator n=1 Tax=Streptomyces sp. IBSBF 2435 TaxID=2903531 RepID=UPI002FDC6D0D
MIEGPEPAVRGPKLVSVHASDPLTAAGIGALLRGRPEFVLLSKQREAEADVTVLAADTLSRDFVGTLHKLSRRTHARFVLILNDRWGADLFTAAELRLAAIVPRGEISAERLCRAILTVSRGGAEFPAEMQGELLVQIRALQRDVLGPRGLNSHGMDSREVDVLRLLAAGCSLREVADELSYSERTIKNILHALMTRQRLRNRTHAVAQAIRKGVI